MKLSRHIGAYGGTFDPIHFGHIEIVRSVINFFALDQLLIIPAYRPPHKRLGAISQAQCRYEMALLAFKDEPGVVVSRMELDAPERPYTVQTMERLRGEYGQEAQLFFIMGADSYAEVTQWRDYQLLLSTVNIIVVTRPGTAIESSHLPIEIQAKVIDLRGCQEEIVDAVRHDGCFIYLTDLVHDSVSATEIRCRVHAGEGIDGLTPPAVIKYIERHKLYL